MHVLTNGAWQLTLLPAPGGAIGGLRRDGVDLLRPTPADADHPFETASFPLVPYANRIAGGRFSFDGQAVAVPRNAEGQAHPLHGVGWRRPWQVTALTESEATLRHAHGGDEDWPWAYAAEQHFTLSDNGLRISLRIESEDARPMPISLGFHPYFNAEGVTALRFAADAVWLADAEMLPTVAADPAHFGDFRQGRDVQPTTLIDNAYAGWSGEACVMRADGDLRLSGSGTSVLHVYMPPGERFFCAEPVTALPDAFNRANPQILAPGETAAIEMAILNA
jgi:aldose 1-epimerase